MSVLDKRNLDSVSCIIGFIPLQFSEFLSKCSVSLPTFHPHNSGLREPCTTHFSVKNVIRSPSVQLGLHISVLSPDIFRLQPCAL